MIRSRSCDDVTIDRYDCAGCVGTQDRARLRHHRRVVADEQLISRLRCRISQVHGTGAADIGASGTAVAGAAVGADLAQVEARGVSIVHRHTATAAGRRAVVVSPRIAAVGPDLAGAAERADMQVDATTAARASMGTGACSGAIATVGQDRPLQHQASSRQTHQTTTVATAIVAVPRASTGAQFRRVAVVTIDAAHPLAIVAVVRRQTTQTSIAATCLTIGAGHVAVCTARVVRTAAVTAQVPALAHIDPTRRVNLYLTAYRQIQAVLLRGRRVRRRQDRTVEQAQGGELVFPGHRHRCGRATAVDHDVHAVVRGIGDDRVGGEVLNLVGHDADLVGQRGRFVAEAVAELRVNGLLAESRRECPIERLRVGLPLRDREAVVLPDHHLGGTNRVRPQLHLRREYIATLGRRDRRIARRAVIDDERTTVRVGRVFLAIEGTKPQVTVRRIRQQRDVPRGRRNILLIGRMHRIGQRHHRQPRGGGTGRIVGERIVDLVEYLVVGALGINRFGLGVGNLELGKLGERQRTFATVDRARRRASCRRQQRYATVRALAVDPLLH